MPKAKKRSESTLHRDELQRGPTVSQTVADLGLNVALPSVLAQTRSDRRSDKVQAKKERSKRIKTALTTIEQRATEVAEHRQFVEAEKHREQQESRMRKMQLKAEHIQARAQRDAAAEQRDRDLKERQAVLVREHLSTLRDREKSERKLQRKLVKELDKRAALEPEAVHIDVHRTSEIQATRESLPVTAEEQPIMEAVNNSRGGAVIVCGETGSGKTTQVPQFLWEAGFGHEEGARAFRDGMICVTEPRRVAAINMAKRVAEELNETFGDTVCYHVRYQNNLSENCKLKFVTEGVLLKEMQSDFMLRRYSAIVIDEAHERSVSCDVLVGLLSRIVPLRQSLFEETRGVVKPLKLVVMSATLRVADFRDNIRLFSSPPPLIQVDVRRFPVSTHYSRTTELHRYVDSAYDKVRQLHKKLPPGGVLVFLATQREIDSLCKRLRDHYAKTRIVYDEKNYRKHSLLASRKQGNTDDAIPGADGDAEEEEEDEFGLAARDYALDGDEDAPGGDGDKSATGGGFAAETGLADDFDYGAMRNIAGDTDSDDDDAKHAARAAARIAAAAKQREQQGKGSAAAASSRWDADDDWGDDGADAEEDVDGELDGDDAAASDGYQQAGASDEDDDDAAAARNAAEEEDEEDGEYDTMYILPLYSLLDHRSQQRVFEPPPPGKRLVVVATNIAETSITIPNIRYVIDAGRVKNKVLQKDTQAQSFKIEWISQAAAEQRCGRAGRVGPGHCYRLYSTAVYANWMPKHADPEILRSPLESVVLMMKHLRIDHVGNFPFPSPPDADALKTSLVHLRRLGALDENFRSTGIGAKLAALPVTPRYGRIILEAIRRFGRKAPQVVAATLSITAVATVTMDLFAVGSEQQPPKALLHPGSDFVTMLRVFNAFAADPTVAFCRRTTIVHKSLTEAAMLRRQLELLVADVESLTTATSSSVVSSASAAVTTSGQPNETQRTEEAPILADFDSNEAVALPPASAVGSVDGSGVHAAAPDGRPAATHRTEAGGPASDATSMQGTLRDVEGVATAAAEVEGASDELVVPPLAKEEELALRRVFITGLVDQVARRATVSECRDAHIKFDDSKTTKTPYWDCTRRSVVFIHPSSSVAHTYPPPEWVVFSVLQRTHRYDKPQQKKKAKRDAVTGVEVSNEPRVFMRGVTIVTKPWLDDAGFAEDDDPIDVGNSV